MRTNREPMDEIATMWLEARHLASFSMRPWFFALVLSWLVQGSLTAQTANTVADASGGIAGLSKPKEIVTAAAQQRRPSAGGSLAGICASGTLQVYAIDTANGWAKTKCAPAPPNIPSDANGFALNWREAASKKADGLTYATFLITGEEVGGQIRFNDSPSYRAVIVGHSGGGGTAWAIRTRDGGPGDDTDWQDLQDTHGMRVVEIAWHATPIKYARGGAVSAGRFTRNSPTRRTLKDMLERPKLLFEWIYDNLNPDHKPFGLIGSSGGADAVMASQVLQSRIKDKISYLAPVSYPPPFYDLLVTCNGPTPPGTFVTTATGELGNSGAGVTEGSGRYLVDAVLSPEGKTNCADKTMTEALAARSGAKDSLQAIVASGGSGYKGTLHILIGTGGDGDVRNGVAWSSGNLLHHPFFAGARRIWYESATEGHGQPFSNVSGPGFTQVHHELVKTLLSPTK